MEPQTFKGKWWSPEAPEEKVPGIVEYHPEQGEADLFGTLVESDEEEETHFLEMNLKNHVDGFLLGETIDSELVTITNAVPVNVTHPSVGDGAGLPNSEYRFTRVYTGGHFHDEPKFSQISFSFDGLAEWFGESRIEYEFADEDELRSRYEVKKPKTIEIELDEADIIFFLGTVASSSVTTIELEDSVGVTVDLDGTLTFPELSNQYINPLQRYLALATTTPVQPTDISGTVEEEDTQVEVLSNIPSHTPEDRSVSQVSMLFRPNDVDLENSLQHWFQNEEGAEYLFNFYFGTLYNSHLFLEHQFLSLAVALESYFSHQYPDFKIMEEDAYRDLRRSLVSDIPDGSEVKKRIHNLLRSIGNLPSFKTKLEMVIKGERPVLPVLIDVDETLSTATTIRHDLAHGLGEDYTTGELVETRHRLQLIIECILLDIAGVEDENRVEVLYSNYRGADFLDVDEEVEP